MTTGCFAEWQPRYAACGIATFPVNGKIPAVRNYLRIGQATSARLVARFGGATAFGIALRPAGLVVLDIDTPDENVLADALDRHGQTPFVVRSGSGNFQAWYRRQDEARHVRPNPALPIDILGDGFVVAPPSAGTRGLYHVVSGSLDDLPRLPVMRNSTPPRANCAVAPGMRNDAMFRHCLREARHCDDSDALLDVARTFNDGLAKALPDAEVTKTARSAWGYSERGQNWTGIGRRVAVTHAQIDGLMQDHPDAFLLLTILRRHHWGRDFVVANAMAGQMPGGGWTVKRLAQARRTLEASGDIELIRSAARYCGPALYRLRVDDSDHQ